MSATRTRPRSLVLVAIGCVAILASGATLGAQRGPAAAAPVVTPIAVPTVGLSIALVPEVSPGVSPQESLAAQNPPRPEQVPPGQVPPGPVPLGQTQPRPGAAPQGPPPGQPLPVLEPPRGRRGQPVNIKVDVTISDQRGGGQPLLKQVSLTLADQESGRIRSEGEVAAFSVSGTEQSPMASVPLNLDVRPELVSDTRVKVFIGLEYDNVDAAVEKGRRPKNMIRETASVILESGKPLVVSQSADPLTDRKVTVEVKATVLR